MKLDQLRKLFKARVPNPEELEYTVCETYGVLGKAKLREILDHADEQGLDVLIGSEFPVDVPTYVFFR